MPYSRINYSVTNDAEGQFNDLAAGLDELGSVMGAQPVKITGITGFDGVSVCVYNVTMGGTMFAMVYFTAYSDNVLINATVDPVYAGSHVSDNHITTLMDAIADSINAR